MQSRSRTAESLIDRVEGFRILIAPRLSACSFACCMISSYAWYLAFIALICIWIAVSYICIALVF